MMKPVYSSLIAAVVLLTGVAAPAQVAPTETAVNEAVRRQADTIVLRQRLVEARSAKSADDLALAAKLYEDAYSLVRRIGTGVEGEAAETVAGLTAVRVDLAQRAQKRADYKEADVQLSRALRVTPGDRDIQALKQENDKLLAAQAGRIPSEEAKELVPGIIQEKVDAGTLVQDGKLLWELGKLKEAEAKLNEALKVDPLNGPAQYYLDLVREAQFRAHARTRESYSRDSLVKVEQAWEMPVQRNLLPVPNPHARDTSVHTGKGRQNIISKLDRIRMDNVFYDNLPLGEVIRQLNEEARKRDPDKRGINFLVNPNEGAAATAAPVATAMDPITGLPITAPPSEEEPTDLAGILIRINPPLTDLRLADVLDAIVKVAEQPIKYSVEDYAIVFSLRGPEPTQLYTRTYKVDPNTFWQGLESVGGFSFGDIEVGSGGSSGGRSGSSSSRGGGGGDQSDTISVPRVNVGGAVSGNRGGGQSGNQSGVGLKFLTKTNSVEETQSAVRQFFISMGVDLVPPKTVFFNDRSGTLWARATLEELDIIDSAIQVLNVSPPQVNIKAKFADIGQRDQRAIGFDWFLGNVLMGNGKIVGSAGTQPTLSGQPSTANPQGFFPGTSLANTYPSSPADQLLTSGLGNPLNAPALATFTGILTDPQFRVVIKALDQREGVDLLSAPEVTTISGRQAQIQVIDIQSIVTGIDLNQTSSGAGGSTLGTGDSGGGAVASTLNYNVQALPFGPVLDVIPYVSADGFSVQLVIIPTVTEFIGYDDPGQFVPQAQSVSGSAAGAGIPLTGQLPLPRFRLRQVTTSAVVWDGQTIVLGGLISESVQKSKDKVPVLGDLPLFGRLFRSESSDTQKRNLVIFVTPTIIDPAGNRYHSEEEMPFAQSSIPSQQPIAPANGAQSQ
jgi:general secretion pathway protein D